MSGMMEPFRIEVREDVLDDLRRRLENTRSPTKFEEKEPGSYGVPREMMDDLLSYWLFEYDWREQERNLNQFNHIVTKINGLRVHFIHERSNDFDGIPLLLLHGWPGSFYEFHKAIPKLTKRSFHCVVPSLPGFGFSEPTNAPGMSARVIGRMFHELMQRLGYKHYAVQGGDWGAVIARMMAMEFPKYCVALHQNFPFVFIPTNEFSLRAASMFTVLATNAVFPSLTLNEREYQGWQRTKKYLREESAYAALHSTRPNTIGVGLTDSPAGLLAWILGNFVSWTDWSKKNSLFDVLSRDEILTNVMLYWVNNAASSSIRIYAETVPTNPEVSSRETIELSGYCPTPTGMAIYPNEIVQLPRRIIEMGTNLKRYAVMPKGGHFAAFEQPELFADDIYQFFHETVDFQECIKLAKTYKPGYGYTSPLWLILVFSAPFLPTPLFLAGAASFAASKL